MAVAWTKARAWVLAGLINVSLPALGASQYDSAVLSDQPSLYLRLSAPSGSVFEKDRSGNAATAVYHPRTSVFKKTALPNGESATVFDGISQYVEVASSDLLSVPPKGALTIEAWIRPDTLDFPSDESDGYVHWAGKGESQQHEYALRMYSRQNTANPSRPSRISAYAFNPSGGLGSGAYFQDSVRRGEWIHVAMLLDTRTSPGMISIYKNGVFRKSTSLAQFNVKPVSGNAPLRVGTRDLRSFFKGAIGKFAVYPRALAESRIRNHYLVMTR